MGGRAADLLSADARSPALLPIADCRLPLLLGASVSLLPLLPTCTVNFIPGSCILEEMGVSLMLLPARRATETAGATKVCGWSGRRDGSFDGGVPLVVAYAARVGGEGGALRLLGARSWTKVCAYPTGGLTTQPRRGEGCNRDIHGASLHDSLLARLAG